MRNILRSKILTAYIILLIATTGLSFAIAEHDENVKTDIYDPVVAGEADGRTVIPFSDYNSIEVYDSEKGIFIAGRENSGKGEFTYDVINSEGEVIQTFDDLGYLWDVTEDKLNFKLVSDNDEEVYGNNVIVNLGKDISDEYTTEEYIFAEINPLNEDILIEEKDCFRVVDKDYNEIFKLKKKGLSGSDNRHLSYMVRFAGNTEYIRAVNKDDTCSLINYKTGEEVYRTAEAEEIIDRTCGKWEVFVYRDDNFSETYFLNDDFTPAFDGIHTNRYLTNDKYIALAGMNASGLTQGEARVFYEDGTEFNYGKYGENVRGFAGDIMYVDKGVNNVFAVMMDGPEKGKVVREGTDLCLMDFDDGIAACCDKKKEGDLYPELTKNEESWIWKWKIVDENYEPLTNDSFCYARETVNGYAVVGILKGDEPCLGVIDFKKDRSEM